MPSSIMLFSIAAAFLMLVLFSFFPIFLTVLYYDLRTRKDGPLIYLDEAPEPLS